MDVYWLAQSETSAPSGNEWLSDGELAVLDRFRIPKRRADWRLGRWTAKLAIVTYLRLPRDPRGFGALEVRPAPSGAPQAFIGGQGAALNLSLSHSEGVGFCVVAAMGMNVGCDVEKVAVRSRSFLTDYFTEDEREMVARSATPQKDAVLTLLWSAKESVLKALTCGLRSDTRSVNVVPLGLAGSPAGEWHPLTASNTGGVTFHGWWRRTRDQVWTVISHPSPLAPTAVRTGAAETVVPPRLTALG